MSCQQPEGCHLQCCLCPTMTHSPRWHDCLLADYVGREFNNAGWWHSDELPEIEKPDLPTDVKDVPELKLWEDLAQNTQQEWLRVKSLHCNIEQVYPASQPALVVVLGQQPAVLWGPAEQNGVACQLGRHQHSLWCCQAVGVGSQLNQSMSGWHTTTTQCTATIIIMVDTKLSWFPTWKPTTGHWVDCEHHLGQDARCIHSVGSWPMWVQSNAGRSESPRQLGWFGS